MKNLSLDVQAGEIVGIAGIDGNGQSELIQAITGLRKVESGSVELKGNQSWGCILDKLQNSAWACS